MKVLLTGAFGNVGQSALEELLRQGHRVRCFDLRTKANERAAHCYGDRIEVIWATCAALKRSPGRWRGRMWSSIWPLSSPNSPPRA